MTQEKIYLAVVNPSEIWITQNGIRRPQKVYNSFRLKAENDSQALILARKQFKERGIRERQFQGVMETKQ